MSNLWNFLRAIAHHWASFVTGGVVIGAIGTWQGTGHPVPPSAYWAIALCALLIAVFATWNDERQAKAKAQVERDAALDAQSVRRDWAGDWKQLERNFGEMQVHRVRADSIGSQCGDEWSIAGNSNLTCDRMRALCQHAGNLLLRSPNVCRTVPPDVFSPDTGDTWLSYLKRTKPTSFRTTGYGKDGDTPISIGSITELASVSANVCVECAGKEY